MGTMITNHSCIQKEIKSRLNLGNACYHAVQNLLSSHLLSRNIKVKICKTIISTCCFAGHKTWSLMVRENHTLREFENRVLRRIFCPERDQVTRG
jgi:hypothetical protein